MPNTQEFEVKIKVTAPSLKEAEQQVANLGKSVGKANKEVEDFSGAADAASAALGKLGIDTKIFGDFQKGAAKAVGGLKSLKVAIAATGVGLLVTAIASLVAYFQSSEEGSRKLAIATETLSILWGELVGLASKLGELIVWVFENPKQAVSDLGQAIKNNIVERFNSLLEVLGFVGDAFKKFFKGDFSGAIDSIKEAGLEMVDVFTGVDGTVEKVVEGATKGFEYIKKKVEEATEAATKIVDTFRNLRDTQQALVVENALLNKELEKQKKIAEDTTLDYETRKAALEEVGKAQIALAANLKEQAQIEEDLLKLQIQTANTYEQREELETQLAEATAARIEAETTLQTVTQDAAKLSRELDLEEVERKKAINDLLTVLDLERIDDQFELARQELAAQEAADLAELENLKATEEQKQKVREAYAEKGNKLAQEEADFKKALAEEELNGKLFVATAAFDAISQLVGEESAAGKAAAVAAATINTYQAATNALANTPLPPPFPQIAAGVAIASGLMNVKKILSTKVPGDKGSGGSAPSIGNNAPRFNAAQAPQTFEAPQQLGATTETTVRAFVVGGDVRSTNEADAKLNNRRTLSS